METQNGPKWKSNRGPNRKAIKASTEMQKCV